MLEKDLLPIFVTGPFYQDSHETDRSFIIKYLLKRKYKVVLPDTLVADNDLIRGPWGIVVERLLAKTDSFEYILSRVALHHFGVGVTDSSHFELGQFHSLMSKWKTTYFQPEFRGKKAKNIKYSTGEYIKIHYSSHISRYPAAYKYVSWKRKDYYPKLTFKKTEDDKGSLWPIPATLSRKLKPFEYKKINFKVRVHTSKLYRYSYITSKSATLKTKEIIHIPVKQAYVMFISFFSSNRRNIKKNLKNPHVIFNNFMDFITDNFFGGKDAEIRIVKSGSRSSNNSLIYSFIYIILNSFSKKIKSGSIWDLGKMIIKYFSDSQSKNPYKEIKIVRKQKTRILTVYNDNIAGDELKEKHSNLKRIDFSSSASTAYKSTTSYIENVTAHRKNIKKSKFNGLKLDLQDFFNTNAKLNPIGLNDVNEYKQGTITGPTLANNSFRKIDAKILSILPNGSIYSRYSDDILITTRSSNSISSIKNKTLKIISDAGYKINPLKTVEFNELTPCKVTGLIIKDNEIWLPNRKSKRLVEWIINPKEYGVTIPFIRDYVKKLDDAEIKYKSETIIKKYLMLK